MLNGKHQILSHVGTSQALSLTGGMFQSLVKRHTVISRLRRAGAAVCFEAVVSQGIKQDLVCELHGNAWMGSRDGGHCVCEELTISEIPHLAYGERFPQWFLAPLASLQQGWTFCCVCVTRLGHSFWLLETLAHQFVSF